MNPLALYALAAAALASFAAGWTARDWKSDADALAVAQRAEKVLQREQAKADSVAEKYERARAKIEPSRIEVRSNIREIYRNVEVPAECAAGDAVVSLLNATRRDANSAASGQPRGELPAGAGTSKPADRPAPRRVGG